MIYIDTCLCAVIEIYMYVYEQKANVIFLR